jgi:hypothetical protein
VHFFFQMAQLILVGFGLCRKGYVMGAKRLLSNFERNLLRELMQRAGLDQAHALDLGTLRVEELSDGGMGSLRFLGPNPDQVPRNPGRQASEIQLKDLDGTLIIASLILDKENNLLELDMWKTNFEPRMIGRETE